jgi:hypothetical protein
MYVPSVLRTDEADGVVSIGSTLHLRVLSVLQFIHLVVDGDIFSLHLLYKILFL